MMLSTANLLSPADGSPVVAPTQDMVLGCYYLTMDPIGKQPKRVRIFASEDEAILSYQLKEKTGVTLHEPVEAEVSAWDAESGQLRLERRRTTVGRIIFNQVLPDQMRFKDAVMKRSDLKDLVDECYRLLGADETAHLVDGIKSVGFDFATRGGMTIGLFDIEVPKDKGARLTAADVEPFLGAAGAVPPWDLTDAIDKGDVPTALAMLHRMLGAGGRHPLVVMATLQGHYERMLRLDGAAVHDRSSAASFLKVAPFQAQKALEQGRRLGHDGLARAFALLAEADLDLRGQRQWPDDLVMEVLVARLARLAPKARASRR